MVSESNRLAESPSRPSLETLMFAAMVLQTVSCSHCGVTTSMPDNKESPLPPSPTPYMTIFKQTWVGMVAVAVLLLPSSLALGYCRAGIVVVDIGWAKREYPRGLENDRGLGAEYSFTDEGRRMRMVFR
ncbi:hypothetical protein ACH5RR_003527 [Cinchona calisaya]|uniref:Uncharacterized protein n=1 Tax=Cinchona calisaya TaxID=153742 RepID=A0ABD3AV53_9GENT